MFKILFGLAIFIIGMGVIMLCSNQIATPHFNRGFGQTEEMHFTGSQVIFIGLVMLLAGMYVQKRDQGH